MKLKEVEIELVVPKLAAKFTQSSEIGEPVNNDLVSWAT